MLPASYGASLVARAAMANDAAFERAWQEGRTMALDDLVVYALDFDSPASRL